MMQAQPAGASGRPQTAEPIVVPYDQPDSDEGQSGDDFDLADDPHDVVRSAKRKRPISVSCELCKQRKVKCDRGQPSCGWCTRNGAPCEYKERKKPGLRAGYGRELEQRLDRLEEVLRAHSEILQSAVLSNTSPGNSSSLGIHNPVPSVRGSNASIPSDHGTPRDTTGPPLFGRGPDSGRTPQAEAALFLQRPSNPIDFTTSAPARLPDSFSTIPGMPGRNLLHPSLPTNAAGQDFYGANSTMQTSLHPVDQALDQDLPPYDLLYALVDLYFKHVNTWCPILHRKTTLDALFGPSVIDQVDKILLHAIVVTTLRFSTDSRLTEERRARYHSVSKQRVILYGMENMSVKALQAMVILALDLCGDSNGPPGWNIMALITRSVVQLGLAVEANSFLVSPGYTSIYTLRAMVLPEPRDFIEDEARRRLFWMVYVLDRYATIATAFEFALNDKEIDRALPCRDDQWMKNQKVETRNFRADESRGDDTGASHTGSIEHEVNKPENLGAFSYYVEIMGILSKIHQFLRQPVDISALSDVESWQLRYKELDTMLNSWKFGLPGDYSNMAKLFQPGSAKTLTPGWVMLHATYHTAVIRLHSSAAYPTTRSPIFTPSYSASQRCLGAAENVTALGEFVVTNGLLTKLGPPFAFTLWVTARLLLVHGSTVERKLSPQLGFFVDTLREMGRYWPVAGRYCQLLQRVLDEHNDSQQQGDTVTPSSVQILADMRRTAFDLDFLISRQPRHVPGSNGSAHSGQAHGQGRQSRYPSVTPARTPAANELEYLDVFDFFNVPRLPVGPGGGDLGGGTGGMGPGAAAAPGQGMDGSMAAAGVGMPGEFNITDFMVDANRDWLFKQDGSKYMA